MSGEATSPVVPAPTQHAVFYAHTLEARGPEAWEPLDQHLGAVSRRAEAFCSRFGVGVWGRVAGLWHDLGKYSIAFQTRVLQAGVDEAFDGAPAPALGSARGRVDHSTAGAQHAAKVLPTPAGPLIAYVIAGYHGHLPDCSGDGSDATLQRRLIKCVEPIHPPADLVAPPDHDALTPVGWRPSPDKAHHAFLTRMVHSALVEWIRERNAPFPPSEPQ